MKILSYLSLSLCLAMAMLIAGVPDNAHAFLRSL